MGVVVGVVGDVTFTGFGAGSGVLGVTGFSSTDSFSLGVGVVVGGATDAGFASSCLGDCSKTKQIH